MPSELGNKIEKRSRELDIVPEKKKTTLNPSSVKHASQPVLKTIKSKHVITQIDDRLPTYYYIWGESGSGKTVFTIDLLEHNLGSEFLQMVFVIPTFSSKSNAWFEFYRKHNFYSNPFVKIIKDPRIVKEYFDSAEEYEKNKHKPLLKNPLLQRKQRELLEKARFADPTLLIPFTREKRAPPTLWVFDDFLGAIERSHVRQNKTKEASLQSLVKHYINELFINGRHRQISCITLTQEESGLKPTARRNCRHVIFFPTPIRVNLKNFGDYLYIVKRKQDCIDILSDIGRAREKHGDKYSAHDETPRNYIHYHKPTGTVIVRMNYKVLLLESSEIQKNVEEYRRKAPLKSEWEPFCWLTLEQKKFFKVE